jgi:putative membrane protein
MKNITYKKATLYGVALILFLSTFSACKNDSNPSEEDKQRAKEHNDAKFDADKEKDADFLVKAVDFSLAEVQLGELAKTGSMYDDTKDLANMLINDHKKALKEANDLASKKGVTVPSSVSNDIQRDYNDLNDKKGKDFDLKYCDMMVKGHKDVIDKFDDASKNATDPDIRSWALNMLPALRTHLDRAMNCLEKCKRM